MFGVEQIVEFPKNSMEKKKKEGEKEREGECHREKSQYGKHFWSPLGGGNLGPFKPKRGKDCTQSPQTLKSQV